MSAICRRLTQKSQHRLTSALSLVELLVVIAVIGILATLVSSAAARAKRSAGRSAELSNLHNLGIAASLYAEANGSWPISATTMVRDSRTPRILVQSPLDKTQYGLTNEIMLFHARWLENLRSMIPDYPVSFTGLGDLGYEPEYFQTRIAAEPGAGWLISLVESEPRGKESYFRFEGVYRRLLLDGSVQTRRHSGFGPENVTHPAFWFADGDHNWKSGISNH